MNQITLLANIQNHIHTIRSVQVMLDKDLAKFYGVETKKLNQAVKRNSQRFPQEFMFKLTKTEFENLRSQFVTSKPHGGRRYLPYVFTELGVAMLSCVLQNKTATQISIEIMRAFIQMRHFLISNATVFQRLDKLEEKQFQTNKNFKKLFLALEKNNLTPQQGIFYNGQVFNAYVFISKLIKSAEKSIILIDNYIDETTLQLFSKKQTGVKVIIYTKKITRLIKLDFEKFQNQHSGLEIKEFKNSHDRFLLIDDEELYHLGASLKDLGKKWFAFSKMNDLSNDILIRLNLA